MINLGNHRSTVDWTIVCCIWLFFNFTPIIEADESLCKSICNLEMQDEQIKYLEFKKLATSDSIKTIFFHIKLRNESFNKGDYDSVYFAWIKNSFGNAVMALPSAFVVMSLSLYTIFIGTLDVTLIDSPRGCLNKSGFYCKEEIIFHTLIQFTQLKFNDTCNDNYCPTICQRRFTLSDSGFYSKIHASCCQKDLINSRINVTTCATNEHNQLFYVPLSALLLIITSGCLAGITLNSIANWLISREQRYEKMGDTPIYILNNIIKCDIGHFYLSSDNNPIMHLTHAIKYTLAAIITVALGHPCLTIQRFPNEFIIYPRLHPAHSPKSIFRFLIWMSVINGICVIMIILADIKLYRYSKRNIDRQDYHIFQRRCRCISQNNFEQSYFQLKCLFFDIFEDLKSLQVIKLILDVLAFAWMLLIFIFGSIGIIRCWMFMVEALTIRFRAAFLSNQPTYRIFNVIISVFFTTVAFMYWSLIIINSLLVLQLIFRVILTTSAFIVTFASYFNFIIIMAIPFMHYTIQIIDSYISNDEIIPKRILHLQQTLDQNMDKILQADQGNLDIYIAISYGSKMTIDLPEMLQEKHIQRCIQRYIRCLRHKPNHQMTDGISTLTISYKRLLHNAVDVNLSKCTSGCSDCPYKQEIRPVLDCIQQHLQQQDIDYFKSKLCKIYYKLEDDPNDINTRIAIPVELYKYLRYYAPQISLTMGRILYNVIAIAAFFSIFILTAMLDYKSETFASLNAAIANTPIIYVATVLSIRNLKMTKLKKKEIDKILLVNMIAYHRGYRLFCTTGIHFQPIIQLFRMTFIDISYLQHIDNIQDQPDDDRNDDRDYLLGNNNLRIN